jgi:glycosyltransferase involved in cell wall biosynthesis
MNVAIAHDYLTQRGGAERVLLTMAKTFPDAPIHTTLYDADGTFPAFRRANVKTTLLNRVSPLRRNHRLAFPVLAPVVSQMHVDADVLLCSTSGWAHGVSTTGAKVVYCHSPARWLYQSDRYVDGMGPLAKAALKALRSPLRRWDRRSASGATYLANSTFVAEEIREVYGVEAEVLPPPVVAADGAEQPVEHLEPGFFLCVSRLLPYKNVDVTVEAFRRLRDERLVVVGDGPELPRIAERSGSNVTFLGTVGDRTLRWLYRNASGLVATSYEDFGLTPLEAASFGTPAAVLRFGGFVDTLAEGRTGVFIDAPEPGEVVRAIDELRQRHWDERTLQAHAGRFSEERFASRLRTVVRRVSEQAA